MPSAMLASPCSTVSSFSGRPVSRATRGARAQTSRHKSALARAVIPSGSATRQEMDGAPPSTACSDTSSMHWRSARRRARRVVSDTPSRNRPCRSRAPREASPAQSTPAGICPSVRGRGSGASEKSSAAAGSTGPRGDRGRNSSATGALRAPRSSTFTRQGTRTGDACTPCRRAMRIPEAPSSTTPTARSPAAGRQGGSAQGKTPRHAFPSHRATIPGNVSVFTTEKSLSSVFSHAPRLSTAARSAPPCRYTA